MHWGEAMLGAGVMPGRASAGGRAIPGAGPRGRGHVGGAAWAGPEKSLLSLIAAVGLSSVFLIPFPLLPEELRFVSR